MAEIIDHSGIVIESPYVFSDEDIILKNIDFDYQLKFVMKVNRYLSTNLSFQAVYNDDALSRLQFKEIFGIGFNYDL